MRTRVQILRIHDLNKAGLDTMVCAYNPSAVGVVWTQKDHGALPATSLGPGFVRDPVSREQGKK